MGVERAVTRWYILRQSLENEIAALESAAQKRAAEDAVVGEDAVLAEERKRAHEKLRALGPCPKPMMG